MLIDLTMQRALEKIKISLGYYTKEIIKTSLDAKKDLENKRKHLVQKKRQAKQKGKHL